jgi:hypothetical protein
MYFFVQIIGSVLKFEGAFHATRQRCGNDENIVEKLRDHLKTPIEFYLA